MEIARNRITTRQFDPEYEVPKEHYEMILEAARHAPSGANSQPWHYIVIRDPEVKQEIADYFVAEQRFRATLKMKFPTPNYAGLATAPGFIVVIADFRYVRAFPMLKDDDSDLNKMYIENAERILLQSVAASTMSAHLAAAALGYNVWWVTAIGQQKAQEASAGSGRAFDSRPHVFRAATQGALQAVEKRARGNHSLGRLQSEKLHDRRRARCLDQEEAPQGHVQRRREN
jgi:nitroreductase